MHRPLAVLALALVAALPAPRASAQSLLQPGDLGIASSTGVFLLQANASSIPLADLSAFGGELKNPAIQWLPDTDAFLVTGEQRLWRVLVLGLPPAVQVQVKDITPAFPAPTTVQLRDLDIHQGTGHLYLLDRLNGRVLQFAPPFAAGMEPIDVWEVGGNVRSMAVDTIGHPHSIVTGEPGQLTRTDVDGGSAVPLFVNFPIGLDVSTEATQHIFFCTGGDTIGRTAGTQFGFVGMNFSGFCLPYLLDPWDVEWEPLSERTYAVGSGLNESCFPGGTTGLQVVRFPISQGPVAPELLTEPTGSGIDGTDADLALVFEDFAYTSPFGPSCAADGGELPELSGFTQPSLGNPFFELRVSDAPSSAPAAVFLGALEVALPFKGLCTLVVEPTFVVGIGATNGQGAASLPLPIPADAILEGLEVRAQAAVQDGTGVILSQGLLLHLGQ